MPSTAKPKRQYRPRPIVNPLNARNDWIMEGEVHAAIRAAVQVTLPALRAANNHAIERAARAAWFAFNRDGGVLLNI